MKYRMMQLLARWMAKKNAITRHERQAITRMAKRRRPAYSKRLKRFADRRRKRKRCKTLGT
jgi:hypothetical protein